MNMTEMQNRNNDVLELGLPEKLTIDVLEEAGDILLLEGMRYLQSVLDRPEDQSVGIKAVNSITNMQKYISQRKRLVITEDSFDDDLGDVFGDE